MSRSSHDAARRSEGTNLAFLSFHVRSPRYPSPPPRLRSTLHRMLCPQPRWHVQRFTRKGTLPHHLAMREETPWKGSRFHSQASDRCRPITEQLRRSIDTVWTGSAWKMAANARLGGRIGTRRRNASVGAVRREGEGRSRGIADEMHGWRIAKAATAVVVGAGLGSRVGVGWEEIMPKVWEMARHFTIEETAEQWWQIIEVPAFALSTAPYLGFLHYLRKCKDAPPGLDTAFACVLVFVVAGIPIELVAKIKYGTGVANIDHLHFLIQFFITATNFQMVLALRKALVRRKKKVD